MKIVDLDATRPDRSPAALDGDTHASPGLRPEVLADAAQRQTKAMIHAALFKVAGEASTIGPYQVLKLLGEGGMGVVYAAYDDKLERKVALKLIRGAAMRRPEGRARTLREARALARLSHPNVVHVYQVGEVDDEIYVAMEFLTGPTLRAWLAAQPRTWREVLAVFRQAGDGLAAAHRQGVIHRDFKPANVIVGDDGRVRVLDFGLAHFGDEGEMRTLPAAGEVMDVLLTQTGAVLGTPAYMAAEQFAGGRGDANTDQFSFCTALYEALYGQRPFVGDKLDALASAVRGGRVQPPTNRRDVPAWLHRVVLRGLQPEPAARWPGMDALLAALSPPELRPRRSRRVAAAVSACALVGGVGYALLQTPPQQPLAADSGQAEEAARGRTALIQSHDARALAEARAFLTTDPLQTLRVLSMLAGDEPFIWQRARFLANAAEVRGVPVQVLRADRPLTDAWPLAGGGLLAHEDLGAVLQWSMSGKTGAVMLPTGSATQVVVARDAPVWAVISGKQVQVFGGDRARTIDLDESMFAGWRLASDGRTLVATSQTTPTARTPWIATVHLWDLTRPGSPPRTITLAPETLPVIADDASIVLARVAKGIRVVRPQAGSEAVLKYRGMPWALAADGQFVVARPDDDSGALDVLAIETGKARRVAAEDVTVLAGSDVLFTRVEYGRPTVRRESLATGVVAWRLPLPGQAGPQDRRLVVDPSHGQFAVAIGEAWGIGDLRRGALTSFVTVPKDSSLKWAGADALMVVTGNEVRIHRPSASPVQVRHDGAGCGLAPGGRWAVVQPRDAGTGQYTRVELASNTTAGFRCPGPPASRGRDDARRTLGAASIVDDAGQVAVFPTDGPSCWWDAQHGARVGAKAVPWGLFAGLPHGVALADGADVEVWTGPDDRARAWTAVGPVVALAASPSGAALAVRSERGVQVLHVDTGAASTVHTWAPPTRKADVEASALAWSPDSTRLAVLDRVEGSLELSVWDVVGEPREVGPPNYVMLGGHVLEDSPGRPANAMTFTPTGAAVALTNRHESVMRVDVASHETRRLDVPDLLDLRMRSETEAVGVDVRGVPYMIDFAIGDVSPLTPNAELGGSTRPPMVVREDGSTWTCAALGPGSLVEIAALDGSAAPALRARLLDLAASL